MVLGLGPWELFLLAYAGALLVALTVSVAVFLGFPRLSRAPLPPDPPPVSVVLPVRNQEETVAACVESLLAQDYPAVEVLVVDGGSEDGTRAVLEGYADRIRVLEEPPLPGGWVGKNWACWTGAREARGALLLFTDGDTVHRSDLLRRAVAFLQDRDVDLLTLYPHLRTETFWERALLTLMIFLIGLSHRGAWVNRPDKEWAVANGQFLLFRRPAYEAVGGHRAVRDRVDEDYRLALRVKGHGLRLCMADGRDGLRVRMYRSLRGIWHGFAKNAFPGLDFRLDRTLGNLAGLFAFLVLPYLLLGLGVVEVLQGRLGLVPMVGTVLALAVWARVAVAYHFLDTSPVYALLAPVAAVLVMGIVADSARRYLSGQGVTWKGRTYGIPER